MPLKFDKDKIKNRMREEFKSAVNGAAIGLVFSQMSLDFLSASFLGYMTLKVMDRFGASSNIAGAILGVAIGTQVLNPDARASWLFLYDRYMQEPIEQIEEPEGVMVKNSAPPMRQSVYTV
jgi:hypothetical protein